MTAKSIVAQSHAFVVGVDTHARNHVYAIIGATTDAGISRAIAWVIRRTSADLPINICSIKVRCIAASHSGHRQ